MRVANRMRASGVSACQPLIRSIASQGCCLESFKRSIDFALPHHLAAVSIQSIIDDPFRSVDFMIVLESQMTKPLCNCVETGTFRLMPERVVRVRAIDNFSEQDQRWITEIV